jgi:hypothetical protein
LLGVLLSSKIDFKIIALLKMFDDLSENIIFFVSSKQFSKKINKLGEERCKYVKYLLPKAHIR